MTKQGTLYLCKFLSMGSGVCLLQGGPESLAWASLGGFSNAACWALPQSDRIRICSLSRPPGDTYAHSSLRGTCLEYCALRLRVRPQEQDKGFLINLPNVAF